ncbi:MAG: hypothetical protein J1E33_06320 [Alistipes sp.]|nr:hypothetical protein [Alistipes sp.]
MENNTPNTVVLDAAKEKFELACKQAQSLQIVDNFGGAFVAAGVVRLLREAMTPEVMNQVFMPLMNTKVGFLTDRTGKIDKKTGRAREPYSMDIVRDCIIDAAALGLLPTGNQFNIIADRMYPTKEGYTYLLKKMGVKYIIEKSYPSMQAQYADIQCRVSYKYKDEVNSFTVKLNIKKDDYSSVEQIQGKAERKAKKALYEYITGTDLGEADEESAQVVDATYEDVTAKDAQSFDASQLKTEQDVKVALLRGHISKAEADALIEQMQQNKPQKEVDTKQPDELFPEDKQ